MGLGAMGEQSAVREERHLIASKALDMPRDSPLPCLHGPVGTGRETFWLCRGGDPSLEGPSRNGLRSRVWIRRARCCDTSRNLSCSSVRGDFFIGLTLPTALSASLPSPETGSSALRIEFAIALSVLLSVPE